MPFLGYIRSPQICSAFLKSLPNATKTTKKKMERDNKSKKGLSSETKHTQNHENRRLGLIESLHMQHCSLRGCIRPPLPPPPTAPLRRLKRYSIFKITRMGSMIPKEIKYNLHYDDVQGDFAAARRHNISYSRVK